MLRPGADAFERLAAVYDELTNAVARAEAEAGRLDALLRPLGAERIHDAACGPGHHLASLADRGFAVSGSDASPAMVERARERLDGITSDLAVLDLARPPRGVSGDADAVICTGNSLPCVGGLAEIRRALRTLVRLTRPGGSVLAHSQNYDRRAPGEIWSGPARSASIAGREHVLLRHYRRRARRVEMDVVVLERSDDGWAETIVPVPLAVMPGDWLREALVTAGCRRVRLMADLAGARFRPTASGDLFALGAVA